MPLSQPLIIPISDKGRIYRLVQEYPYEWEEDKKKHRITVPEGFEYDGASIPQFMWSIIGLRPDGLIRAAALVHDFLYRYEGKLPNHKRTYTRLEADRIYLRLAKEAGVSRFRRNFSYRFIRTWGWIKWRE